MTRRKGDTADFIAAVVASIAITVLTVLWTAFWFWFAWNVCNIHDVFGIPVDATFEQIVVAAIFSGVLRPSSSSS